MLNFTSIGNQDASFFYHNNEAGMEARQRALVAALDDMLGWLESGGGWMGGERHY